MKNGRFVAPSSGDAANSGNAAFFFSSFASFKPRRVLFLFFLLFLFSLLNLHEILIILSYSCYNIFPIPLPPPLRSCHSYTHHFFKFLLLSKTARHLMCDKHWVCILPYFHPLLRAPFDTPLIFLAYLSFRVIDPVQCMQLFSNKAILVVFPSSFLKRTYTNFLSFPKSRLFFCFPIHSRPHLFSFKESRM